MPEQLGLFAPPTTSASAAGATWRSRYSRAGSSSLASCACRPSALSGSTAWALAAYGCACSQTRARVTSRGSGLGMEMWSVRMAVARAGSGGALACS